MRETGPFFFAASVSLAGVSRSTRGQTDMRGLVTAGRAVRRERAAGLESERGHDHLGLIMVVHRSVAGRSSRGNRVAATGGEVLAACYSSTARDQAQPASSRATATSATAGRFLRAVKLCQRWCSRRLPSWPRARAAAGASSHRSRIVLPGTR